MALALFLVLNHTSVLGEKYDSTIPVVLGDTEAKTKKDKIVLPKYVPLDKDLYDKKIIELANHYFPPEPAVVEPVPSADGTVPVAPPAKVVPPPLWPPKTVYPKDGAILPFNRIVAYYGNFYSTKMGALGEYEEDVMLAKLDAEVKRWTAADPSTPAIPAIHYIALTAQGSPGADGMYRFRMPKEQIDIALRMAEKIHGIVFLDIQVGLSTVQKEVEVLEPYLKLPNVHLGIDPEFAMKNGAKPGTVIGTVDASEINAVAAYLARLVQENDLPPKILIIHRFTQRMVTNAELIEPLPEVQVVMDMDGWGSQAKKKGTYRQVIYPEPVQFTGFKIFYKNDLKEPSTGLLTPEDLLQLEPRPIYIQYQ